MLRAGVLAIAASLETLASSESKIEISLAEWSLHRAIYGGRLDHLDFPRVAREKFGISAVEYVNGFFRAKSMDFRAAAKNSVDLKELLMPRVWVQRELDKPLDRLLG
jgi:hypothetical protein